MPGNGRGWACACQATHGRCWQSLLLKNRPVCSQHNTKPPPSRPKTVSFALHLRQNGNSSSDTPPEHSISQTKQAWMESSWESILEIETAPATSNTSARTNLPTPATTSGFATRANRPKGSTHSADRRRGKGRAGERGRDGGAGGRCRDGRGRDIMPSDHRRSAGTKADTCCRRYRAIKPTDYRGSASAAACDARRAV